MPELGSHVDCGRQATGDEELRRWIYEVETAQAQELSLDTESTVTVLGAGTSPHRGSSLGDKASLRLSHDGKLASTLANFKIPRHKSPRRRSADVVRFPGQLREMQLSAGSVFLVDSNGDLLKLPIPSDQPEDPLHWSQRKRAGAMLCLVVFHIVCISADQLPEVNFHRLESDPTLVPTSSITLEQLLVFPTLWVGIGSFVFTPLYVAIGRRPVFLTCISLVAVGCVLAATAKSFNQLLAAVSLQGFGSAPAWGMLLLCVTDMTFIHERPQAVSLYWCLGGMGVLSVLALQPRLVATGLLQGKWRSLEWIWASLCLLTLIMAYFLLPETYFVRPAVAYDGKILIQSAGEKVHIYDEGQVRGPENRSRAPRRQRFWNWGKRSSWEDAVACYPQILLCLANPLVFCLALLNTLSFAGLIAIASVFPPLLTSPPYNVPSASLGWFTLAGALGAFLAWPACGILTSVYLYGVTKRNGGVRHAEYYLPAFVLPLLAGVSGLVLFGVCAQHKLDKTLLYVSYVLYMFNFAGHSVASTLWVTEAFPQWATAALTAVCGLGYMLSFGVSYALPHLLRLYGYDATCIALAAGITLLGLIAVPMLFWGKDVRQYRKC